MLVTLHSRVCARVLADVLLSVVDRVDKAKALSLMLHAADISHPAKAWELHYRWTQALMEEFFRQVRALLWPAGPRECHFKQEDMLLNCEKLWTD